MTLRDPRLLLLTAFAVAIFVPLARVDWFWGDERTSYILRTVEWAAELRAGVLYPRWCPDFYGGYGSPLFMFYGPVIYGLAGFLTAMGTDVVHALKVVVLLGCLASAWGAYALVLKECRQRDAALLGAVAFLAAPYFSGNVYSRGDLGEFSCLALLPSVLALYRASAFEPRPVRARWLAGGAALLHAVLIMTHPVLGLWGSLIIGAVVAVTALGLARRTPRRAVELIAALASAPLLTGLYVVPALVDRKATHAANMIVNYYDPRQHWLGLGELFDPAGFMMIGPLVGFTLVIVLCGLVLHFRDGVRALGWLGLCLTLLGLNLPEMSWFWAPNRVPLAPFIQFPWRLLGPAALAAAVALGVGMAAALGRAGKVRSFAAAVAGAALLSSFTWSHVGAPEMSTAGVPREGEALRQGMASATDADEYLPLSADAVPTAPQRELVLKADGANVQYAHSDGSRHAVAVQAKRRGAEVTLALHSFPGWQVQTLEGPRPATLAATPHGLIALRLPAPGRYRLRVFFGASNAAKLGYVVTALGVALLACVLLDWPRRRLRRPGSAR